MTTPLPPLGITRAERSECIQQILDALPVAEQVRFLSELQRSAAEDRDALLTNWRRTAGSYTARGRPETTDRLAISQYMHAQTLKRHPERAVLEAKDALAELTRLSEELGLYELDAKHDAFEAGQRAVKEARAELAAEREALGRYLASRGADSTQLIRESRDPELAIEEAHTSGYREARAELAAERRATLPQMRIDVRGESCVVEFYDARGVVEHQLTVTRRRVQLTAPWWLPRSYPSDGGERLRFVESLITKRIPDRDTREGLSRVLEAISQLIKPQLFQEDKG